MKVRIGTRGSKLALAQTEMVAKAIKEKNPSIAIEIIDIKTIGDRKQGTPQASFGDKKDWVYDLELALLSNSIDLAVHSGKDVPPNIERGTAVAPVLKRADPRDAFIGKLQGNTRLSFSQLPRGAVIGTASLRRKASLLRLRPDLKIVEHRGNITTRISKLDQSDELSGIVLACAGLERIGMEIEYSKFPCSEFMPALNQGTLVAQFLETRDDINSLIKTLSDPDTLVAFQAERACAEILEGDCHSAVSIFAELRNGTLSLSCRVMTHDGTKSVEILLKDQPDNAILLGKKVGESAISKGAKEIIAQCKK